MTAVTARHPRPLPLLFVASALVLALVGSACGAVAPYAAKVNGVRITTRDLERELDAIRGNEQYLEAIEGQLAAQGGRVLGAGEGTFSSAFVSQVLTRRILLELVHQEVDRRNLRVTQDALDQAREQLEQSFGDPAVFERFPKDYVDELVTNTVEIDLLRGALKPRAVSDRQVREFYEQNPSFFEETCARQIVTGGFELGAPVSPEQDAQAKAAAEEIKRRVDAGEDFAAIARAESKDQRSAPAGGDLGCMPASAFPPAVVGALAEAQPGQVVGPVRTDTGYHVVQFQGRRTQPLEEAIPQIRQFLESQGQDAVTEFVQKAAADADVTVNPRYGTFDEALPAVVPPQAPATSTTTTTEP